jgi:hypothetical protein
LQTIVTNRPKTTPPPQEATEKLRATEERAAEAQAGVERMEAHVRDLESRKRAPLYQKKQVRARGRVYMCVRALAGAGRVLYCTVLKIAGGVAVSGVQCGVQRAEPRRHTSVCVAATTSPPQEAELQAAVDKAVEAEARASEAEVRMREAKVSLDCCLWG